MSNGDIICPACGRANPGTARTCANCATVLAVPTTPGGNPITDADRKRLVENETIYAAELGTVQGGTWEGVSTERKPGNLPLPPQVQAESLRREREEVRRKAIAHRVARERAELEARRAQQEAVAREAAIAKEQAAAARVAASVQTAIASQTSTARKAVGRVCSECGTPAPQADKGTGFSFCLNCGASFADTKGQQQTESALPAVPPIITVTSPVGVLRQQARREVREVMPVSDRHEMPYPGTPGGAVRVTERVDILPVTEATPYVAAILSFLLPGVGQMRNAQWSKGLALLLATFALFALLPVGIWSITAVILRVVVALDAFRIAERRRRGLTVSPWQWDASFIAEH